MEPPPHDRLLSDPPPGGAPWWEDPTQVDRLLDGEMDPREAAHREAEAAADPALACLLARRRAFLDALRAAGSAAPRPDATRLAALEARVRAAWDSAVPQGARHEAARARRMAWGLATAAMLLLSVGWFVLQGREVEAASPVLMAADLHRVGAAAARPAGTCADEGSTSPYRFSLVTREDLEVKGCTSPAQEAFTQALLHRPGDLENVGYVALPDAGATGTSPEVGVTRLDDVVVFDVRLRGTAYYLGVARDFVDRRGTCAACHGNLRENQPNPHHIVERRLR